ncbi:small ribosomal subunit Rsm22 family protein, partial [Mesorhizobium sp. M2E.F.Ca.ET.209.01.1.1]|uniref:small ribosomal subunit Rsm22 family protein n=1 Tax=Mesorhizobium sp. M2E.F.Ca.ET.209.01.1.1 TaxID=2500526 RepID=UPI002484A11C
GTMLWATSDLWPELELATLLEASAAVRKICETLAADAIAARSIWQAGDVTTDLADLQPADLVTCAYVLDEIVPASLAKMIDRLWHLTTGTLLIIEPGTPAGW